MEWLPFDLHPDYPPEGIPRSRLAARYGEGFDERTREAVEAAGWTYNPPPQIPNSRRALAVTELARDRGLHEPVHSRLMHAYWTEAANIGDEDVLLGLVEEAGLERSEAEATLADGGAYAERVLASTRRANMHGIDAIPAFVLDGSLLVVGAHPHATFERAFDLLEQRKED